MSKRGLPRLTRETLDQPTVERLIHIATVGINHPATITAYHDRGNRLKAVWENGRIVAYRVYLVGDNWQGAVKGDESR